MDKEELIDKTATALSNMKLSKETVKDILTNFAREINSSGLNEAKAVRQNEDKEEFNHDIPISKIPKTWDEQIKLQNPHLDSD